MMFSKTLSEKFSAFKRDQRGNVAIIFGLAAIPLMLGAGMAVDYARAVTTKNSLQSASDAAALAAASLSGVSDDERIAMAKNVFQANFKASGGVTPGPLKVTFVEGGVRVTQKAKVDTVLMKLAGVEDIELSTKAEVNLPKRAEIALVLDYSGSMKDKLNGQQKYITMRDAAKKLVSDLSGGASTGRVEIGLVPFSHHVYTSLPGDFVIGADPSETWTGCTYDRRSPHNVNDTTPLSLNDNTKWGNTTSIWNFDKHGCDGYVDNSLVVQPLTDNTQSIQTQLDVMEPYVWTNIALGMSFGWHLLSPNLPYAEGADYNDGETIKAIVLLTDGKQTAFSWGSDGEQSRENGERNLETTCDNIKALNPDPDDPQFLIITVAFDLDDPGTVNRLRDCATAEEHFYRADDNSELSSAFNAILEQISAKIAITG